MSRIGIRRSIARRVLNHKQRGVDGVYDLHEYLKQKRRALRRWTKHCVALESAAIRQSELGSSSVSTPLGREDHIGTVAKRQMHSLTRQELHAGDVVVNRLLGSAAPRTMNECQQIGCQIPMKVTAAAISEGPLRIAPDE
jgi:hypothetical protein